MPSPCAVRELPLRDRWEEHRVVRGVDFVRIAQKVPGMEPFIEHAALCMLFEQAEARLTRESAGWFRIVWLEQLMTRLACDAATWKALRLALVTDTEADADTDTDTESDADADTAAATCADLSEDLAFWCEHSDDGGFETGDDSEKT